MSNKITILIATLNSESTLQNLFDSLLNQTDPNFDIFISDGLSTDKTIEIIRFNQKKLNIKFHSTSDFGIYDALNRGLGYVISDYYLVVGSDDILNSHTIENYLSILGSFPFDIICTSIQQNGKIINPKKRLGWLYGMPGITSSHSVGMLINRKLHDKFGYYSQNYHIAADQLFIKTVVYGGASVYHSNFVSGEFSVNGISGTDSLSLITDIFRVQFETEKFKFLQIILFMLRLFKFYVREFIISK
jgi:glycosyltransferase involved in cell wall biosynthesis